MNGPPHPIGPGSTDLWRRPLMVLLLVYGVCIIYSTLLPFQFTLHPDTIAKTGMMGRNLVQRVSGWPASPTDLLGNIVLFLPLGAFAYGAQARPRSDAPGRAVWIATLYGLLLSFGVETVQYFTPVRETSTSDLVWNTCGSFLGAAGACAYPRRLLGSRLGRVLLRARSDSALTALVGMTVVLGFRALVPFDVSIQRVVLRRSLQAVQLDPTQDPASLAHLADHALAHALLAALLYGFVRRWRGSVSSVLWSLGVTLGLSSLLEGMQLMIKSRIVATLDVVAAMVGGVGGALWAVLAGPGRSYCGVALWAPYLAILSVSSLHLFGMGTLPDVLQERLAVLVPQYGRYFAATLAGITEFTNLFLLYAPLGFMAATRLPARSEWGPERRSWLAGAACSGFALLLEIIQLAVPAGEPKLVHAIPAFLGALAGALTCAWTSPMRDAAS